MFFSCDDTIGNLTNVETMSLDTRVKQLPKNSEIQNCLPSCHLGIWSLLMLRIIWQHSITEEDLGINARIKHHIISTQSPLRLLR